jgi:hypothetical protein
MADGPSVDAAGQRALKAGITVDAIFDMVRRFRQETGDDDTPILLMGYYNLVYQRGVEKFCKDASAAGIDGRQALAGGAEIFGGLRLLRVGARHYRYQIGERGCRA